MKPAILIRDIRLPPGHHQEDLISAAAQKAGMTPDAVERAGWRVVRRSIDARRRPDITIQYHVEIGPPESEISGLRNFFEHRPAGGRTVVVGAGPAGLFAGLALALAGQAPLIIEQGLPMEQRQADVARFWSSGVFNPSSNVQFGEGGAGTFSDGKLTTRIKDPRCRAVLEELILAGAPPDILVSSRPHLGTDNLRRIVRHLRERIIRLGGEFIFECRLIDFRQIHGRIVGITVTTRKSQDRVSYEDIPAERVILAIGHSARQTFQLLDNNGILLAPKPFSLGVRIEHLQSRIDYSQYGSSAGHPQLPPADYQLSCHLPSGRSVYTFCMCPGGQVVAAASETGGVVTNGMSYHARNQANANSALLVGVQPEDFPDPGPLGGIAWQRRLEQQAFDLAGGGYRAPAQYVGDFLKDPKASRFLIGSEDHVAPSYLPGVNWCDLDACLPSFVTQALREALPILERRLAGFAHGRAVLTGVETRSSSPVRIIRDARLQASLSGLFPCGEGSGYAGGIMSSVIDGLRCAQAVLAM